MAFTGTPIVELVADNLVRITGLLLAGAANGVIGLHEKGGTPGVRLPAGFKPRPYKSAGGPVSLQDSVEVSMNVVSTVVTLVPIKVVKSGNDADDFAITLTNTTVATASAELEIYIRHH